LHTLSSLAIANDGQSIRLQFKPTAGPEASILLSTAEVSIVTTALLSAGISAGKKTGAPPKELPHGHVLKIDRCDVRSSPDDPRIVMVTFVLPGGLDVPLAIPKDQIPDLCKSLQTEADRQQSDRATPHKH
jgi:hypothetical protein